MIFKKVVLFTLMMTIAVFFAACGASAQNSNGAEADKVTLDFFAPDASLEPIVTLVHNYSSFCPDVDIRITFDTGDMLTAKVEAGYQCDVLLSDRSVYLDWLDINVVGQGNPNKNDRLVSDSRVDLVSGPALLEDGSENPDPLTYSLALIKDSAHQEEARKFLDYVTSEACDEVFEMYGFAPL
ncbi:MAG: extracellular solute-binding protein [Clostridia bacterium]|nr:extracellular solute-binding protein [Clostridia bacterium]